MQNSLIEQLQELTDKYAPIFAPIPTFVPQDGFVKGIALFVKTHSLTAEHVGNLGANLERGERPSGYNDVAYFMRCSPEQVAGHRHNSSNTAYNFPGKAGLVPRILPPDADSDGAWGSAVKALEERV